MENAKCEVRNAKANAKCRMQNAELNVKCEMRIKCEVRSAKCELNAECEMRSAKLWGETTSSLCEKACRAQKEGT